MIFLTSRKINGNAAVTEFLLRKLGQRRKVHIFYVMHVTESESVK